MAHKTLINGTAYEINGGKTLVGGTGYSIAGGKTLVGGTGYDISFFSVPPLAECTPAEIQAVAQSGQAASCWAVGDMVPITLNGTVGNLTFSNETYYAFILGFDHNSTYEGSNSIHFQFGKTADGVDIAFVDSNYNKNQSSGFCWNTTNQNAGGWKSSYMRSTICPAFKAAMPVEWRNVISPCTKYTDNTGSQSKAESAVTATADDIFCLSEFEARGKIFHGNEYEKNYQKRYDYFTNGNNSTILRRVKHNDLSAKIYWWLRSPSIYYTYVCKIGAYEENSTYGDNGAPNRSYGFAPCFKVS